MPEAIPEKRGWILAALMLTMILAAMDTTIVSTAIPQIVSDLGGFNQFSWVFSIYLLAQTVTIPIYGKLADIFGRKSILIIGIIIFLIGSLSSALSWNISSLIAFRGIQGLGAGSIMATVNTIAGDIYSVEERAKIQGYLSSIWGISAIIGPALGGALAEYVNWRWIFFINLPFGIISIFFLMRFFDEKVFSKKSKIDYKGAVLILSSLALLLIFLLEGGQSWPWLSAQSIGLFILVVTLSLLTYRTEKKTEHAIMPVWVWKNKTFAFTNLAMAGMGITMMGPDTFFPTFTQTSLGLGMIASGFVLASMSFGWPVASALSGKVYLKIGFRETSIIGAFIVLIACLFFIFIPRPQPIYLLVFDQVLIGFGFGFLSTPSLVGIQSMVNWEQRGVVTSSNIFARNLGQSLGATIFGAIFNNSIASHIKNAPTEIANSTSSLINLIKDPTLSETSLDFLQNAVSQSMHYIYYGMIVFALLIVVCLVLVPHRSPKNFSVLNV